MVGHYHSRSSHSILQAENREVLETVRSEEDVHVAHHRVLGMNFIPGGYTIPASVQEASTKAREPTHSQHSGGDGHAAAVTSPRQ